MIMDFETDVIMTIMSNRNVILFINTLKCLYEGRVTNQ